MRGGGGGEGGGQNRQQEREIWLVGFSKCHHGGATISRLLKITGLSCRIYSLLKGSFAKKTCNFKETTNYSHPIVAFAKVH